MKKEKSKINVLITLPTTKTFFTVEDLVPFNPNIPVFITLRSKLITKIKEGVVAEVGYLTGGQGRPKKVYVKTPITGILLDKAEAEGISLVDRAREKFRLFYL